MPPNTVLVTGGSGFTASHCILQLFNAGYSVRTTIRDLKREPEVRALLKNGGLDPADRLTFFAADLSTDSNWQEAANGCDYILHVASPFPPKAPKHEDDLIIPARDGTLRVLRAARSAQVKRVVVTSSFAAIGYGHPQRAYPFTEDDWTDPNAKDIRPYVKSKTVAERAAWDFIAKEGNGLELSVVNPVAILGPVLAADYSPSIQIVQRLLAGQIPACPRIYFGVVDVRDVAGLHLLAMIHPAAKNERFLALSGNFVSFVEIAQILKANLGPAAKAPTRELPDWFVRIMGRFVPPLKEILPELGKKKNATNEKAVRLLGWSPRSPQEAILATAESLQRLN